MPPLREIMNKLNRWSSAHPKRAQIVLCSLIVLGMGVYTFAFSNANLSKQLRYSQRIQALTDECKRLDDAYRSDSLKIDNYKRDKASLERIAREEYRMQRPEEVIFFIKDHPANEDEQS